MKIVEVKNFHAKKICTMRFCSRMNQGDEIDCGFLVVTRGVGGYRRGCGKYGDGIKLGKDGRPLRCRRCRDE